MEVHTTFAGRLNKTNVVHGSTSFFTLSDDRTLTMAVLSLPLTFTNSFWSQDYRRGLEVLYGKLEQVRAAHISSVALRLCPFFYQGIAENDEIVAFVRVCSCVSSFGNHLTSPRPVHLRRVILPATSAIQLSLEKLVRHNKKRALHDDVLMDMQALVSAAMMVPPS